LINQTPTDEDRWILMKNNRLVLGKIIRWFKAKSAKEIHEKGHLEFQWQRNYYEKIIRNERQLNAIREYIRNNPLNWAQDPDNPINFNNKDLQKDL
jgi:REP element-mobilizing transposase RayT